MKANLYQLEKEFTAEAILAAEDLIRQTRDFSFETTSRNHYLFSSFQPDYQVEIIQRTGGETVSTCQCHMFQRHDVCKHAIAALLVLRSKKKRTSKEPKGQKQDKMVADLVKKLSREDLKSIIEKYAASHEAFRLELLARNLHKASNPDYFSLLQSAIPVTSKGVIDLQRKQVKIIRTLFSILHQQLQEDLKRLEMDHAVMVIESVIPAIGKLIKPELKYRDAFAQDHKAFQIAFEKISYLPMAPGLQERLVKLSLEFTSRDSHILLPGKPPMLEWVRQFTTSNKDRKEALRIAIQKMQTHPEELTSWGLYLIKAYQEWNDPALHSEIIKTIKPHIVKMILQASFVSAHKEVLTLWELSKEAELPDEKGHQVLSAVFESAVHLSRFDIAESTANILIVVHHDLEKFEWLIQNFADDASRIISRLTNLYDPGDDKQADEVIVYGLIQLQRFDDAWQRMRLFKDSLSFIKFETKLPPSYRHEKISWYSMYIQSLQSNYGGESIRSELQYIFDHLKRNGMIEEVKDKIKTQPNSTDNMENTSPIEGFIFDLDGVIVNSAVHHFEAWQTIMRRLGAEITEEDDHHTRGASRMESFEYLLTTYGIQLSQDEKERLADEKNQLYLDGIRHITPIDLLPGVYNFIQEARKRGIKIALGSASKNARLVLERLQITEMFDSIVDGNDVLRSKPDPEVFIKAANALNLLPAQTIVFEDAAKGIQASVSAGCHTVGLGDKETLKQADLVLPGLDNVSVDYILQHIA